MKRLLHFFTVTLLCWFMSGCATSSPSSQGTDTSITPISIVINQATIRFDTSHCVISCDVTVNNRTGRTLLVNSQFSSLLEDFNLLIYDGEENLSFDLRRAKEAGLWFDHRSPHSIAPNHVPLAPGQTITTITFLVPASAIPASAAVNTPSSQIKVRLAGHFAGGTNLYPVVSDITPSTIANSEEARIGGLRPHNFWNISPR